MISIKRNIIKMKNPSSGEFEGIPAISGTSGGAGISNYELAIRNGFTGTEEEFLQQFVPDNIINAMTNLSQSTHVHENATILAGITSETVTKWDNKQDRPLNLSLTLSTSSANYVAETDPTIKSLGANYRFNHTTDVPFTTVTGVSASVDILNRDAANSAGLLDGIGYDTNSAGKTVLSLFVKQIPTSAIVVAVQIQR